MRMVSQASWLLLLGLLSCISLAGPTKLKHTSSYQEPFVDQCTPVPTWSISAEKAVNLVGPNITVIALLNSSMLYGRRQAGMLSLLRNRLYQAGFPSINFMVINSMLAIENTEILKNEAPNIAIYQEQRGQPVSDVLGAENDHILVLDRCGRMAYQVITPFSKLTYPYVKAAILSTYKDNPCGFCNQTEEGKILQNEGGNESLLAYASDAPDTADCHNRNMSTGICQMDLVVLIPEKSANERSNTLRREILKKEDARNQSFIHSVDVVVPTNALNSSVLDSLSNKRGNSSISSGDNFSPTFEVRTMPRTGEDHKEPEVMQDPSKIESRSDDHFLKNWDWSQTHNQSNLMTLEAENSNEQSVEVVRMSRKKKKKKGTGKELKQHMDTRNIMPAETQATNCRYSQKYTSNSLKQSSARNLNSREGEANSMEQLVNQTQRLYDWYQKQIENGTSSEEEYERSNTLKSKIIEHYSRLLPWLNYKLTPQNST